MQGAVGGAPILLQIGQVIPASELNLVLLLRVTGVLPRLSRRLLVTDHGTGLEEAPGRSTTIAAAEELVEDLPDSRSPRRRRRWAGREEDEEAG